MKLTRLLLLLSLLVSLLVVPEAFGAKAKPRGALSHSHHKAKSMAKVCEWFDIYCGGVWTDECCGTVNGCLVSCVDTCGGPCIYRG